MSNGKMTFRFDAGKDKPKELQPESGLEATMREQRAEVYSLDEARRTGGGRPGKSVTPSRSGIQEREYRLEELEQAYHNNKKTAGGVAHLQGREADGYADRRVGGDFADRWSFPVDTRDVAANREEQDGADRGNIDTHPEHPEPGPGPWPLTGRETDGELLRDSFLRSRRNGELKNGQTEFGESDTGFDSDAPAFTEDDRTAEGGSFQGWTDEPEDGGGYYTPRRSSSWWKLSVSVAGALGIGVLLGYAALTFIGGIHNVDSGGAASTSTAVRQNAASVPAVPVQVAGQNYYLLQYGVFSTPEGAEQAKRELVDAGLAAGIDPEDGNRVYAGLSSDREQAKLLGNRLKTQGIDLYVKEVALPSASQLVFNGSGETVTRYFEASGELLGGLSSLSATLLGGDTSADTAKISDLHMRWTEAVKALEAGLPSGAQATAQELEKSVSQGVSAMNEYGKSKADGLLWEVQSSMLAMLNGQKQLIAAMEQQ